MKLPHSQSNTLARLAALVLAACGCAPVAGQALSCDESYGISAGTIRRMVAPYTNGASPPLFADAALSGVNGLGVNPQDLGKIYYLDALVPPVAGERALYYVDLTASPPTSGHLAVPPFNTPFTASDTLAFDAGGHAMSYAWTTATLYRQGSPALSFTTLTGAGPSADPRQYVVNDILIDAAGMVYAVGLYPSNGAPASAHLLRFDPALGQAEYLRPVTPSPMPASFPANSSGLAFAPGSTDAAPRLLWTPSSGAYVIDVFTGVATRASGTSRADLASCPRHVIARRVTLGKQWAGATDQAVNLAIGGSSSLIAPVAGQSSAAGTTTLATVNALPGSTVTLSEQFTSGAAGDFAAALSCVKASDGRAAGVVGQLVNVPADSDLQCTFSNRKRPRLTLRKHVVDLPGASAPAPSAWTLQADGGALGAISGAAGSAAVTAALAQEGDYVLSESGGMAGYAASAWSCSGAAALNGDRVTLQAGADVSCQVTNTRISGAFELTTSVVGAPPSQPWAYSLSASGANAALCLPAPLTASVPAGGGVASFAPLPSHGSDGSICTYALAQTAQAGWEIDAAASSSLSGLTVPAGGGALILTVVNRRVSVPQPQPIPTLPAWPAMAAALAWLGWRRLRSGDWWAKHGSS